MRIVNWLFNRVKITYGITVCNEVAELKRLVDFLLITKKKRDEIVILWDVTNRDGAVASLLEKYEGKVLIQEAFLQGDFAAFKNNLLNLATGDYLFQIDADEVPAVSLIAKLGRTLLRKSKYDCFLVPRINTVAGISIQHLNDWNWKMDDRKRINFPDYQTRIFKLNKGIHWKNKVHEELVGWNRQYHFPIRNEDYCLLHEKHIDKQTEQNEFYQNLS